MKTNLKNLLIVFLVALLGGFLGVYGGNAIYNLDNPTVDTNSDTIKATYSNTQYSSLKEGISKAYNTVVEVTSDATSSFFGQQYESISMGSGVIISADGYIITNEHVIDGATTITVEDVNGNTYDATLIGSDSKTDIAVLKIDAENLTYAEIADSDSLEIGDDAIVIGNPLGTGISVTNGIISALNKEVTIENETMYLIQTNAAVNKGNSGGGLFDINGNLIGIVNAKSSSTSSSVSVEGLGYAIPSNTVINIANDIIDNGYVRNRATLGVTITEISKDTAGFPKGVYITSIVEGGAADDAGLQTYDRIVALDGKEVNSYSELSAILNSMSIGDNTTITVIRNNEELTLDITLKENIQTNQ